MSKQWIETRFPGYFVSVDGEVRGRFGRVLRPAPSGCEGRYLKVSCGKGNSQNVHKLVAESFLGPCPEGFEVSHVNGNGHDNRVQNLVYKTHVENERDKELHGTKNHPGQPGESNPRAKLTEQQVFDIRMEPRPVNISALARHYGVARSTISNVLTGRSWNNG